MTPWIPTHSFKEESSDLINRVSFQARSLYFLGKTNQKDKFWESGCQGERPKSPEPEVPRKMLKIPQDGPPPNSLKKKIKRYKKFLKTHFLVFFCLGVGHFEFFLFFSGLGDLGHSPWQLDSQDELICYKLLGGCWGWGIWMCTQRNINPKSHKVSEAPSPLLYSTHCATLRECQMPL